ncbi:MAG: ribulose-phosphate 3-epimerase [Oscillospiraceae bacterium]|nr:ribulose-phosphate 3-epimerase [Oscillospiraceae bacterium]
MIKIAPSILSADFTKLGDEIKSIDSADYLHFDVMDGLFVPNISIGLPVLESLRAITDMVIDVHLMIESPSRFVERFAQSGADIVVFHVEAEAPENILPAINSVRKLGKRAGLSIKPDTPAEAVLPYISALDIALIMTVEPGFGGQRFIQTTLPKITLLRNAIERLELDCELEVDGGINLETAKQCVEAGANVIVAGSEIFKVPDRAARITALRACSA